MEEKILIYVAGNPDAYPLEYYDTDTESYRGVIPELLHKFSEQSQYDIVYYRSGDKDQRESLAKNRQVDVLSGYKQGDEAASGFQAVTIFHAARDGEQVAYQLYLTDVAPENFKQDLGEFLTSVSQEQVSGLLIDTAQQEHTHEEFYYAISGLLLSVVVLISVIVTLIVRYRKKIKKTRQDSEIDETTGIGNMDYLVRYYKQIINDKNRILYNLICFHVDTDRLRRLSGNDEADEFLRYCSVVLKEYTSDSDILAKISDQSFVILRLSASTEKTEAWLTPLMFEINTYTEKYGKPFEVKMTAGVYPIKTGDRNLDEMLFSARQAAVAADEENKHYLFFSDKMRQRIALERQLQADLDQAFLRDEFPLYIQFYVDAHSFRTIGGEALSRWAHPRKGLLMPKDFIPLLERENMIGRLDYYCLKKTCDFLERLFRNQIDTFFVSCNFSRKTWVKPDFVTNCKKIMDAYHFPKHLLIFEITESASVKNISKVKQNIIAMKEYGVRIAIDDYGEGFTSFYDLQEYSVDGIKLDKGLIDNLATKNGKAILHAMIQLGHEMGVTILAEGVETDEQVYILQQLHCDAIQGFRFNHPLPDYEAEKKIVEQFKRYPTSQDLV